MVYREFGENGNPSESYESSSMWGPEGPLWKPLWWGSETQAAPVISTQQAIVQPVQPTISQIVSLISKETGIGESQIKDNLPHTMAQVEAMINLFEAVTENNGQNIASAQKSFVEATISGGAIPTQQALTPNLAQAYVKYIDLINSGAYNPPVISPSETISEPSPQILTSPSLAGFPTWMWLVIGGLGISILAGRKKKQ